MKKLADNILSWCNNPEEGAVRQAINISKHPWLVGNVCLMSDCHEGYGMPIGGVVALDGAICPNMVGVDIGCGMLAVKTSLTEITTEQLKKIMGIIREKIPVGFKHHSKPQEHKLFEVMNFNETNVCVAEFERAKYQLGTLGGGNHFIEIQKGDDGHIWFMIHSGSRNLGKKVADYYIDVAKHLCERWKQYDLIKNELCVIPLCEDSFADYMLEMNICLAFSNANRELMAKRIKEAFETVIGDVSFDDDINIQHNYATIENHYGKNVWVHRKGATLARKDTIGIIPGSQGTSSYIVKGKGNEASLCSCSHGAGRKLSRKKARECLNLEEEQRILDEKGIIHAIRNVEDLDESSSAYKNIDEVMEQQKDLVDILVKLEPLAVVKG